MISAVSRKLPCSRSIKAALYKSKAVASALNGWANGRGSVALKG
jgi:hypothetical protein